MDFHPVQPPNLTDSTRHNPNGFPPNSTTKFDQLDQAGIQCNLNGFSLNLTDSTRLHLSELGGNPLRLHCMPAWLNQLNWVVELVKLGGNPLRLCLVELG